MTTQKTTVPPPPATPGQRPDQPLAQIADTQNAAREKAEAEAEAEAKSVSRPGSTA